MKKNLKSARRLSRVKRKKKVRSIVAVRKNHNDDADYRGGNVLYKYNNKRYRHSRVFPDRESALFASRALREVVMWVIVAVKVWLLAH